MSRPGHPYECSCQQCKDYARTSQADYNSPEETARRQYDGIRQRREAHVKKIAALDPLKKYLVRKPGTWVREWLLPADIPIGADFIGEPGGAPSGKLWTKDCDKPEEN